MKYFCSFWGFCSQSHSNESTNIELAISNPPENINIQLTSAIYSTDDKIKWDDPDTRNLMYAKGKQKRAIENYEYLYDCYLMRKIVEDKTIETDAKKDELVRDFAKNLFSKHITDVGADLLVYFVKINNQDERVRNAINISGELREKFKKVHADIDNFNHKNLLSLYESAIEELRESLELPPKRSSISFGISLGSIRSNLFPSRQNSSSIKKVVDNNHDDISKRDRQVSVITWAHPEPSFQSTNIK